MKLRTSFFNTTVFKKDLTRFSPAWALYTVGLFMMLAVCTDASEQYRQACNIASTISFMAIINFGYGLLNAQLLFGDLFNARHCNALHAMPLRRECWFLTHTVAGLAFSFVPNLAMTLVAAAILESGWVVAFWWLLAVTLQYLFFFGLAVLAALCVGNRFAMVLLYGIINFLALILYWFYYSIYQPLLYGVFLEQEAFTRFSPLWTIAENGYDMLLINRNVDLHMVRTVELGAGWGYAALCAAIGVALLGVALLLYRRRRLESAGDFMAVRPLEPVFLGLYTLSTAAFFQMFAELFEQPAYFFLGLGIIIGFFTGRMLLKRTIRIFQPRAILACVLCGLIFAGSMILTAADPVGITRYVPAAEQVAGICVTSSRHENASDIRMEDPRDVEKAVALHRAILDGKAYLDRDGDYFSVCVSYVLKNGKTVSRYYSDVGVGSEAGKLAEYFFNRTEYILGGNPAEILDSLYSVNYNEYGQGHYGNLPVDMGRDLMQAVIEDCDAGRMIQHWAYRPDTDAAIGYVDFEWKDANGRVIYNGVEVTTEATRTAAYIEQTILPWLEENGY